MRKFLLISMTVLLMFGVTPFLNCGGPASEKETASGVDGSVVSQEKAASDASPGTPESTGNVVDMEPPPPATGNANQPYVEPKGVTPSKDNFSVLAGNFEVATSKEETRFCFVFDNPNKEDRYIHRFEPVVPNPTLVKRMMVLADSGPKQEPRDCSTDGGEDKKTNLLFVWMPGVKTFQFPANTGVLLRSDVRVRVVIQYHNTSAQPVKDNSGFKLYHVPKVEKVYRLLSNPVEKINILAGEDKSLGSKCRALQDFEMLAGVPMLGKAGTSFISEIIRPDGSREELIFLKDWSPDKHWGIYSFPYKLTEEDKLITTCSWSNRAKDPTTNGWKTQQEMCDLLVYIHTKSNRTLCDKSGGAPTYKPPAIKFKPGACAPKESLSSPADVPIQTKLGELDADFGFKGGDWTDSTWELKGGEVVFKSSLVGNFLKREYTLASGQLRTGANFHFDVVVQAVIEYSGRLIPYKLPISISGLYQKGSKPGEFSVDIKCGKLDISQMTYESSSNGLQIAAVVKYVTNFGNLDFVFKLQFEKKK